MNDNNETLGAMLGGMIAFDHALTNSLTDSHLDEAISWARKFEKLYQRMEFALESGNAVAAYNLLADFEYDYDNVPSKINHYQSMKMSGRGEDY